MHPLTVLIRCDASARVGYGHLMRCLALAEALRASGRWQVIFAMTEDVGGIDVARARGFAIERLRGDVDAQNNALAEARWLALLAERHQPALLVLDIRTALRPAALHTLRLQGMKVAVIDDGSDRRLQADIAFYPPVPQLAALDWRGHAGQRKIGWEWILMSPAFAEERARCDALMLPVAPATTQPPRVLVTLGGSDPAGLTAGVLRAIDTMQEAFDVTVVIGQAFTGETELAAVLGEASRRIQVLRDPPSMAAVMAQADIAIASFGATAYELAAMGVPAIHLCLTEDHAQSASALAAAGASVNLGVHTRINPAQIRAALREWLTHPQARSNAGHTARTLIDGAGASRVMRALDALFEDSHALIA